MTVWVDDAAIPFGRMIMCHMAADSREELLEMADRIGVDRRHLQKPGTYREHMNVCKAKRRLAVKAGALEVTTRELVEKMRQKREKVSGGDA